MGKVLFIYFKIVYFIMLPLSMILGKRFIKFVKTQKRACLARFSLALNRLLAIRYIIHTKITS